MVAIRADRPPAGPRRAAHRRMAWLLHRYPVTVVVTGPYLLLVVAPALAFDNPDAGFVLRLVLVAGVTVAVTETLLRLLTRGRERRVGASGPEHPAALTVARVVAVVSVVADVVAALAGRGTLAAQVAVELPSSPVAALASLFFGWKYLAIALLLYSVLRGQARAASFYRWAAALIAAQLAVAALTAITAPVAAYLVVVVAAGTVAGVVRSAYVVVALAVLLLAWPALFALRNDIRIAGGVRVDTTVSAHDRLRLDLQMARLEPYSVPADVGQPGLVQVVVYGLVPRVLDPDRSALSTGARINQYLGGSARSSYSFLSVGNVYFLDGLAGVIVYFGLWSGLAVLLTYNIRGAPGPVRLSLFCFVVAGPLCWSSTYPDTMVAVLQYTVAAAPVFLVLRATRAAAGGTRQRAAA
ncbi:hypothetical protein RB614_27185 [Phytohabitans sp. ZYX-F-186]|uniref:Oligosaccharide repeat unit polymerase n=1 Tax=Phytohabitans maris TaxID=3071409 RepID=A0ABU0ZMJ2_9ACTN|nr:hypothetical protein [Phytohabitans sp. ZYX-F-186]MDQ7908215.1 hypothetical protein [Phytohabitans sp. ZYX-F-186]